MIFLIALIASAPLIAMLFAILPARRAMVVGTIGTWVLLPSSGIDFAGLPIFDKFMTISIGVVVGTAVFAPGRILSFQPRWFDLVPLAYCLGSSATAISNDLGQYNAASTAFRQMMMWMVPYLIGRLYLTDAAGFRELTFGMIISGICLAPLCLYEMKLSPRLMAEVYGLRNAFTGLKFGGFRPQVFFQDGLALGLWMNTVSLSAWWLWRTGGFRALWGIPSGAIVVALVITTILCRSTGATILILGGIVILWCCTKFKVKWLLACLLSIAPIYYSVRITHLWSGQSAVDLATTLLGEARAASLQTRFWEEDVLIDKALRRPLFGWGGFDRARTVEDDSRIGVDSLWSITFGETGFVGLLTMTLLLELPVMLFLVRFPVAQWDHPDLAAATVMAMIVALFLFDCLSNAMLNPIYLIAAGGLVNLKPARVRRPASDCVAGMRASSGRPALPPAGPVAGGRGKASIGVATRSQVADENLAARYQSLGRAAKDRGQAIDAKAAWQHALDLWTEVMAADPDHPGLHQAWCDCANDLAWLLASAADPAVRDPAGAVALAVKAVELNSGCSTYWNTLGAARYRTGDFQAATADLDQAVALGNGGTVFDHVFLAMAHAQLGNRELARRWFDLTMIEMDQSPPGHAELRGLREEASTMLSAVSVAVTAP